MALERNIVLIGFMGTGKTTVGKQLAQRMKLTFVDMDDCIVERAGKSIPDIFADDGEPAFRQLERDVASDLSRKSGLVIATGGGVVLNPDNITDLGENGMLVALIASPDVILERLQHDTGRPLLSEGDKGEKIRNLLASREHLYNAIPDKIDTDPLDSEEVVARIMELYAQRNT
jgi:shikimate kinase